MQNRKQFLIKKHACIVKIFNTHIYLLFKRESALLQWKRRFDRSHARASLASSLSNKSFSLSLRVDWIDHVTRSDESYTCIFLSVWRFNLRREELLCRRLVLKRHCIKLLIYTQEKTFAFFIKEIAQVCLTNTVRRNGARSSWLAPRWLRETRAQTKTAFVRAWRHVQLVKEWNVLFIPI